MSNLKPSLSLIDLKVYLLNLKMDLRKKRGKKVNLEQKEIIVNFLENNKNLVLSKIAPQDINDVEEKWNELKNHLNSVENGAKKDLFARLYSIWLFTTSVSKMVSSVYSLLTINSMVSNF
jgi:predicted GNAT superfamily acetyltransferase